MRILFLYEGYDEYIVQLWSNIKNRIPDSLISLITTPGADVRYKEKLSLGKGEEIYVESDPWVYLPFGTLSVLRRLPHFDIVHITYMELKWGLLASTIRKKADKMIISVGGGDLYESANKPQNRLALSRLVKRADLISSENSQTKRRFVEVFGRYCKGTPHQVVRYGVNVIDAINDHKDSSVKDLRDKWGFPNDKIVVMLGHNRFKQHQHLKMIASVAAMPKELIDKSFFVIPMTYGPDDKEYRSMITNNMDSITDQYTILDEFMNVDQMAELTMITDVMIHVQTTDQLSSTMMAHLYNGNVVIAGSWLPYEDIKEAGIKLYDVDDFEDLTEVLSDVIARLEEHRAECAANKERVYRFSSWEHCAEDWLKMYE